VDELGFFEEWAEAQVGSGRHRRREPIDLDDVVHACPPFLDVVFG